MTKAATKKVAAKKSRNAKPATLQDLPARYAHLMRVGAPSPEQVKRMREKTGLTQAQAALLIYVDVDTWRQYEKPKVQSNARTMRAGLWELFLLKIGDIEPHMYNPPILAFERVEPKAEKKPALFKRAGP